MVVAIKVVPFLQGGKHKAKSSSSSSSESSSDEDAKKMQSKKVTPVLKKKESSSSSDTSSDSSSGKAMKFIEQLTRLFKSMVPKILACINQGTCY